MSDSNYKHKSGAQKRRLKSERESKASRGRQSITKFFRTENEKNVAPGTDRSEGGDDDSCDIEVQTENQYQMDS